MTSNIFPSLFPIKFPFLDFFPKLTSLVNPQAEAEKTCAEMLLSTYFSTIANEEKTYSNEFQEFFFNTKTGKMFRSKLNENRDPVEVDIDPTSEFGKLIALIKENCVDKTKVSYIKSEQYTQKFQPEVHYGADLVIQGYVPEKKIFVGRIGKYAFLGVYTDVPEEKDKRKENGIFSFTLYSGLRQINSFNQSNKQITERLKLIFPEKATEIFYSAFSGDYYD